MNVGMDTFNIEIVANKEEEGACAEHERWPRALAHSVALLSEVEGQMAGWVAAPHELWLNNDGH